MQAPPAQWLPVHFYDDGAGLSVEWLHFGFARLVQPFYEQSTARAALRPAFGLLRLSTPLDAVLPLATAPMPGALVHHMSRCGSTLVAQMLAQRDDVTVVVEAPAFDYVLRAWLAGKASADHVRGMAGALARDRHEPAGHRVFKLDAWHVLAVAQIAMLFPDARSAFLFRDPLEVLVSQAARPGLHMTRGAVPLPLFGLHGEERVDDADYPAWVLAGIMRAGIRAVRDHGALACDYADLPGALTDRMLPHFRIAASGAQREAMHAKAARHSKDPAAPFQPDSECKRAAVTDSLAASAERLGLARLYHALRHPAAGDGAPAGQRLRVHFDFDRRGSPQLGPVGFVLFPGADGSLGWRHALR